MGRISDDSPEYYLCGVCERLHLWRNVPHPGLLRFESICPVSSSLPDYSDTNLAVWELSNTHYYLDSAHVQVAIRQHLHGPRYGFAADSLSYTEVRVPEFEVNWSFIPEHSVLFREHAMRVTSIDARVFPSPASLCLRVQSLLVGHEKFVQGKDKEDAAASWGDFIRLNQCEHLRCIPREFMDSGMDVTLDGLVKYRQIPESLESKFVATCKRCQKYYKFEVRRFSGEYLAFISTRYIDLGSGEGSDGYATALTRAPEDAKLSKDFPDPRARFENCPGDGSRNILSEEESILRNVGLVTEQKYKDELTRLTPESRIWFKRAELS
ncbi:hypothetical protein PoHVEF18_007463 [Penicillium ochrochloron]